MEEKKLILKGNELYNSKEYEKAIEVYDSALKLDPFHELTYIKLSLCYRAQNKLSLALECVDRSLTVKPNYIIGLVEKAGILISMSMLNEANKYLDAAIKMNPNYIKAYCLKGRIMINKNNNNDALKYYDKAINLNDNYLDAHLGNGIALSNQGYYIEGMKCLDKAIQIYERNITNIANGVTINEYSKALYYKAKCLYKARMINEAGDYINRAIEIEKENMNQSNSDNEGEINESYLYGGCSTNSNKVLSIYRALKEKIDSSPIDNRLMNSSLNSSSNIIGGNINNTNNTKEDESTQSIANKIDILELKEDSKKNDIQFNKYMNSQSPIKTKKSQPTTSIKKTTKTSQSKLSSRISNQSKEEKKRNDVEIKHLKKEVTISSPKKEPSSHNNNIMNTSSNASMIPPSPLYEEYIETGKKLSKEGNKKDALSYFSKALEISPSSIEAMKLKANALKLLGNKEQSLSLYQQAFSLSSKSKLDEIILINIANLNLSMNHTKEAMKYYTMILNYNSHNENALKGKAACLFSNHSYKEAIQVYEQLLTKNKNDVNSIFNRSVCLFEMKNYTEALQSYKSFTKLISNNYIAYRNMAQCEEELSHFDSAISYYDRAISFVKDLNTKNDLLYKKGYCLFENNKLPEAEKVFTSIINNDKNNANAYCGIGLCLNKRGQYQEGIQYYDKAIAKDSYNPLYYLYKAYGLVDMKNVKEGNRVIEQCEEVLEENRNGLDEEVIGQIKEKISKLKIVIMKK